MRENVINKFLKTFQRETSTCKDSYIKSRLLSLDMGRDFGFTLLLNSNLNAAVNIACLRLLQVIEDES